MNTKTEEQQHIDLPVSGMSCVNCAQTIEQQLTGTPGVVKASVNFATATATVDFDPRRATRAELAGVIEQLGYHVAASGEDTSALEEEEYR